MTILVCDHIHQKGLDILASDPSITLINAADEPKDILVTKFLPQADVAITRSSTDVDENFLNHAKKLKALVRAGVGVDNVDTPACSKLGIVVMNVPTANTIAAVELTMAHMLSCVRKFPYAHNNLKLDRVWRRQDWYGTELKGKKLGVIGFGNIGSRVAKRAKAFEMNVITYDPYISPTKATDMDIQYTSNFDDILNCDIITIHTPKTKETIDMISTNEISKMKDGVILINCARGGLYNEEAIIDGLSSGKIAMAGIDVFNTEPAISNPLLDQTNITVTPHLGANTKESQQNIAIQAAENAILSAKGISYPNALNLPIKESDLPDFLKPYLQLSQKIGHLIAQLSQSGIKSIKISTDGKISDYIDSLATFATVGLLSESIGDKINYVNAEHVATQRDIDVIKEANNGNSALTGNLSIRANTINGNMLSITGTVLGEQEERIINIDGYTLDLEPRGKLILFKNSDTPGVIGDVGRIIANHNINISDFRLGRDENSQALAVVKVDEDITRLLLEELANLKACISVRSAVI